MTTNDLHVDAVRVHGVDDLRVDHLDLPGPRPDQAVVATSFGGVCGSDIHYWRDGAVGASVLRAPMVLGHEVVGVVAAAAADGSGPRTGTRVAVHPATTCGQCAWCRSRQPHLCVRCRYLGSAGQWPHTDGGFATGLLVASDHLIALPSGLTDRRAVLAEPTAIAWHAVSRVAAVHGSVHGADVLVVGGGPIGLLVAAVSGHYGAATVTVLDVRDHPLAVARAIGVDRAVRACDLDGDDRFAVVFESSGTAPGLADALTFTRRGGVVVAVGQLPGGPVTAPLSLVIANEVTMTGSLRMDHELAPAVRFLADAPGTVDAVITETLPYTRAAEAFALAADADRSTKVVLTF